MIMMPEDSMDYTKSLVQTRDALKQEISELVQLPKNCITEVCVTDDKNVLFSVLAEQSFSVQINDKGLVEETLELISSFEPIEDIPF